MRPPGILLSFRKSGLLLLRWRAGFAVVALLIEAKFVRLKTFGAFSSRLRTQARHFPQGSQQRARVLNAIRYYAAVFRADFSVGSVCPLDPRTSICR